MTVIMTRANHSFMHVLVQRLTRSSPAQTCTPDCSSPSLVHLIDGGIDPTSRVRVPSVSVQSRTNSDEHLCSMPRRLNCWALLQKSVPEICAPVPHGKVWQCQRVSGSWLAKLRGYKASPLAQRRTAKPATKAGLYLCRNPHG